MTLPDNVEAIVQRYLNDSSLHVRNRAEIVLLTLAGKSDAEIAEETSLSPSTINKWQRAWEEEGLAIFPEQDAAPAPEEKAPLEARVFDFPNIESIAATDSIREAARKIMLKQLKEFVSHEETARIGADIEGVHKMRVATRRLRSAYLLLGDYLDKPYFKKFPKQLRQTGRVLGEVRDLDVLMEQYTQAYPADEAGLKPLFQQRYDEARSNLLEWLDDARFMKFTTRFFVLLTTSTDDDFSISNHVDYLLPGMIYTHLATVRAYDDVVDDADPETLHSLRIEFKQLRYLLEFFTDVLGKTSGKVIDEIKTMQDHLGALNDAIVADEVLRSLQKSLPKDQREGVIAYREARQAEAEKMLETFPAAWDRFNRQAVREALAAAIGAL